MLVDHDSFGEFPGGLVLQAVAENQGHELSRHHPIAGLETGVEVRPFAPESSFSHRHKNTRARGPDR